MEKEFRVYGLKEMYDNEQPSIPTDIDAVQFTTYELISIDNEFYLNRVFKKFKYCVSYADIYPNYVAIFKDKQHAITEFNKYFDEVWNTYCKAYTDDELNVLKEQTKQEFISMNPYLDNANSNIENDTADIGQLFAITTHYLYDHYIDMQINRHKRFHNNDADAQGHSKEYCIKHNIVCCDGQNFGVFEIDDIKTDHVNRLFELIYPPKISEFESLVDNTLVSNKLFTNPYKSDIITPKMVKEKKL